MLFNSVAQYYLSRDKLYYVTIQLVTVIWIHYEDH